MNVTLLENGQWDLSLDIGGRSYATREPTLREMRDAERQADVIPWINAVLTDCNKPDWDNIGFSALTLAVTSYQAYTRQYLAKKHEAVLAAVMAGTAPSAL